MVVTVLCVPDSLDSGLRRGRVQVEDGAPSKRLPTPQAPHKRLLTPQASPKRWKMAAAHALAPERLGGDFRSTDTGKLKML